MSPADYVTALQGMRFDNVFNPYSDRCQEFDSVMAPNLRSNYLHEVIEAAVRVEIDSVWIGRDLGYRGGRRTGLALTDDAHLRTHAARWEVSITRPTIGSELSERTAGTIWRLLNLISDNIFLWNVFPFHPHLPEEPFSNRAHCKLEKNAGEELLIELIEMLKPSRIIAIGNDAGESARCFKKDIEIFQVRHPSYGGQAEFIDQITALYLS